MKCKVRYVSDCGRVGKRGAHLISLFEQNNPYFIETKNLAR
jgi:hypothetical protein